MKTLKYFAFSCVVVVGVASVSQEDELLGSERAQSGSASRNIMVRPIDNGNGESLSISFSTNINGQNVETTGCLAVGVRDRLRPHWGDDVARWMQQVVGILEDSGVPLTEPWWHALRHLIESRINWGPLSESAVSKVFGFDVPTRWKEIWKTLNELDVIDYSEEVQLVNLVRLMGKNVKFERVDESNLKVQVTYQGHTYSFVLNDQSTPGRITQIQEAVRAIFDELYEAGVVLREKDVEDIQKMLNRTLESGEVPQEFPDCLARLWPLGQKWIRAYLTELRRERP